MYVLLKEFERIDGLQNFVYYLAYTECLFFCKLFRVDYCVTRFHVRKDVLATCGLHSSVLESKHDLRRLSTPK